MSMRRATHTCRAGQCGQKTLQRRDAAWAAQQAAVHADAHHLGRVVASGVALGIQRVKRVFQYWKNGSACE